MPPPGMPPPGMPPQAHGMPPQHGGPMMVPGRAPVPVAKTVAIGQASSGQIPIAATAFGSMTVGILTCTRGRLQGQRFSLTSQGLLIGRQPGLAQIVIDDPRSSGKHVWIGYEQGQLVAIDQGTTNGTFVNDVRYGRISKAVLKDGDTVIVSEPDCLSLTLKIS
jgi:pSer/pThr/pTyr-binding forkhead associated (FHA) protein